MVKKSLQDRFLELIEKSKNTLEFKLEELLYDLTEAIYERMEELGLSQHDLAKKLGVSDAYVSRILKGNENLTLKNLLKLAMALELDLEIHLEPQEKKRFIKKHSENVRWSPYYKTTHLNFRENKFSYAA